MKWNQRTQSFIFTAFQRNANVDDAGDVSKADAVKPKAEPVRWALINKPSRTVDVLKIVEDMLKNGSHLMNAQRHQTIQWGRDVRENKTGAWGST